MKQLTLPTVLATAFFVSCTATQPQADPESTVVNPDGTVTFNYRNDVAREVQVDVQFAGRHDMLRDTVTGLWSLTLGPASPDMYPYCFVVDGVSIMDPHCSQWFPNEGFKNSLLDIPGQDQALIHSIQAVPHGNVDYIHYHSSAIDAYNNALVYTPPTYTENPDKSYPVFYLISGTTDTEEVYYKVGRMNYILDNLLAQGAAQEMIIVLPYGNPAKLAGGKDLFGQYDLFSQDLLGDLMPYVESHYRTINDRDHRAIGGFSRGGNQGLSTGLRNLDKFSYLCSYSSFTSTDIPYVYDHAKDTNEKLHLFWLGVGTDDFLYGTARDYEEFLDQKGIRTVKEYTTDKFGHTWMNAKYFLDKTLRLLFNPEASESAMAAGNPALAATGQEQAFTPGVMARLFPKPILSPEFVKDSVTFRLKAPEASQVELDLDGQLLPMEADTAGIWSATLAALTPDVYCYNFVIDGALQVMDPQNMYLAPDRGFKRSVLEMPGAPYYINDYITDYSPVTIVSTSDPQGAQVRYAICQSSQPSEVKMPVIALLADGRDTFESWFKIAHANIIMDQMVAEGVCLPCKLYMIEDPDLVPEECEYMLRSADYATWSQARDALVKLLVSTMQ